MDSIALRVMLFLALNGMDKFIFRLNVWHTYNTQHDSWFLTKGTHLALSHTVATFDIIIKDLVGNCVMLNGLIVN